MTIRITKEQTKIAQNIMTLAPIITEMQTTHIVIIIQQTSAR